MIKQIQYNAYTGISCSKKNAIVQFLCENLEGSWVKQDAILQAVEYAIKEIPSFGGFILTTEINEQIIAVIIVNKTGMGGYMPEYVVVLNAIAPNYKGKGITKSLIEKAITLGKGDISMLVKDYGPKELLLENLAVEAKYMQMKPSTENLVKASA